MKNCGHKCCYFKSYFCAMQPRCYTSAPRTAFLSNQPTSEKRVELCIFCTCSFSFSTIYKPHLVRETSYHIRKSHDRNKTRKQNTKNQNKGDLIRIMSEFDSFRTIKLTQSECDVYMDVILLTL